VVIPCRDKRRLRSETAIFEKNIKNQMGSAPGLQCLQRGLVALNIATIMEHRAQIVFWTAANNEGKNFSVVSSGKQCAVAPKSLHWSRMPVFWMGRRKV